MSRTILCLSFVTSSIVTDHEIATCKHISILVYFFLCRAILISLSLSLPLSLFFSSFGWRATECWIKRKKPGITAFPVVARISRNKSTRFSFSFFLFFNSFEHLLLVISCFPSPFLFTSLCTLLVDNSSMLGQQQKRRRCGKKNFERCNQIEL